MKDLQYFMNLNYTLMVRCEKDFDGSDYFVATYNELDGLEGVGETQQSAIEDLNMAKEVWFEVNIELGRPIPEPYRNIRREQIKLTLRVPYSLNDRIDDYMRAEGISKNNAINVLVMAGLHAEEMEHTERMYQRAINFIGDKLAFVHNTNPKAIDADIPNSLPTDAKQQYHSPVRFKSLMEV